MKLLALASAGLLIPVFAFGALAQDTVAPETAGGEEMGDDQNAEGMDDADDMADGEDMADDEGMADGEGGAVQAWFTEEQAETGQRTFAISCGGCHGADMVDVFATYDTAEEYFLFASGSMPADNPGSLANQQYVDIIAYLMRETGFPAGDETLPADREILAQIVPADGMNGGDADDAAEDDAEAEDSDVGAEGSDDEADDTEDEAESAGSAG